MKNLIFIFWLLTVAKASAQQQHKILRDSIPSGKQGKFHVQGIAVDQTRGFVYFSFTDRLVKMNVNGTLIGSVTGFLGHLGDLDITDEGNIYGSLEYKNDEIGKGISKSLGGQDQHEDGFYIAIFDCSKITRPDMDIEDSNLLKTIYIREAVKDYQATVKSGNETKLHRFACSGIDGIAFAPAPGGVDPGKKYLYVAYGVYGDNDRTDNDHQVLLRYDTANWDKFGKKLSQDQLHHSGPEKPLGKYFVKTGSTRYGIQNLAYDPSTGNLFAAVYRGTKSQFPNYDLFMIDLHRKPVNSRILSSDHSVKVKTLSLSQTGPKDEATEIRGWHFKWGATGLCPLGNGLFYISHNKKDKEGFEHSTVHKYKWVGDDEKAFILQD